MQVQPAGQRWISRVWGSTKRWFEEDRIWLQPTPPSYFVLRDTKRLHDDPEDVKTTSSRQDEEVSLPFDPSDPNTW